MKMPVLYIAGPYRGPSQAAVDLNVEVARKVGALVAMKGWAPLIPHANTAGLEHVTALPDQFWLDATLELMRRCDAVVLLPGWRRSTGTAGEIAEARRLKLPIYMSEDHVPDAADFIAANDNRARA